MSNYAWKITRDYLDDKNVEVYGPFDITDEQKQRLDKKEGSPFRMYDDDGELYYAGKIIGDDIDQFEPLDDYGTPNAGCTEIRYWNANTGTWETL